MTSPEPSPEPDATRSPPAGSAPLLLEGGHDAGGTALDLLLAAGEVVAAGAAARSHPWARDAERLDCSRRTLLPAAAEPHSHLDKAFLADRADNQAGDLIGAIGSFRAVAAAMTEDDVLARARRAAQIALAHGFVAIRSHVDVGAEIRGRPVAALAALREELRGLIDLQLVAFIYDPASGHTGLSRRQELDAALEQGAEIVGGAPWLDSDPRQAVDELTAAAAAAGCPIDLHVDETTDTSVLILERYVEQVERLGLGGRATASHCVSLGQLPEQQARELSLKLAAAGVAVVTLPQTNLLLQGRQSPACCPRGLAPLRLLEQAGVLLAAGGDNCQDPFNPLGRIDPFETASLVVAAGHLQPTLAYGLVSDHARAVMGLPPAGPHPGLVADLLAIRGGNLREAFASASEDRIVLRAGRVVARTEVISVPVDHQR